MILATALGVFSFTASAAAAIPVSVTLAWDANSETNVAGYIVYYGTTSSNYTSTTNVGNQTSATLTGLSAGTRYYFSATAFDQDGLESDFAPEISYTPQAMVPAPTLSITSNYLFFANGGATVIPFGMTYAGSATNSLAFYVTSSDPLLFPAQSLQVSGSGSNRTLTLTPASNRAGAASVTVIVTDGTVSNSVALSVRALLAAPESADLQYSSGQGTKVRIASLLGTNSSGLQMASVGPASTQGGAVASRRSWVFYTPPATLPSTDSFQYSVSDGRGGWATNSVPVSLRLNTAPSGNYALGGANPGWLMGFDSGVTRQYPVRFDGIPGRTYTFNFADDSDLLDWQGLGAGTMDALGRYLYLDTIPDDVPGRLYQTVCQ